MTDIVDAVENVRDAEFASDTNEYSTLTEAVVLLLDQRHEIERLRAALREVLSDYEAHEPGEVRLYTKPLHDPEILRRAREALGDN